MDWQRRDADGRHGTLQQQFLLDAELPLPFLPAVPGPTEALIQDAPLLGSGPALLQQRRQNAQPAAAAAQLPRRYAPDPDLIVTFDDGDLEPAAQPAQGGLLHTGGASGAVGRAPATAAPAAAAPMRRAVAKVASNPGSPARLSQLPAKRKRPAPIGGSATGLGAGSGAVKAAKSAALGRPLAAAPPLGSARPSQLIKKPPAPIATATPRSSRRHSGGSKPKTPTDAAALRRRIGELEAKIQAAKRQQTAASGTRPGGPPEADTGSDIGAANQEADVSALVDQFLSSIHDDMAVAAGSGPAEDAAGDAAPPATESRPRSAATPGGSGADGSTSGSSGSGSYTSGSSGSRSWSASGSASSANAGRSSAESGDRSAEAGAGGISSAAEAPLSDDVSPEQAAEEARLRRQLILRARIEAAERDTAAELRRRGLPNIDHLLRRAVAPPPPEQQPLQLLPAASPPLQQQSNAAAAAATQPSAMASEAATLADSVPHSQPVSIRAAARVLGGADPAAMQPQVSKPQLREQKSLRQRGPTVKPAATAGKLGDNICKAAAHLQSTVVPVPQQPAAHQLPRKPTAQPAPPAESVAAPTPPATNKGSDRSSPRVSTRQQQAAERSSPPAAGRQRRDEAQRRRPERRSASPQQHRPRSRSRDRSRGGGRYQNSRRSTRSRSRSRRGDGEAGRRSRSPLRRDRPHSRDGNRSRSRSRRRSVGRRSGTEARVDRERMQGSAAGSRGQQQSRQAEPMAAGKQASAAAVPQPAAAGAASPPGAKDTPHSASDAFPDMQPLQRAGATGPHSKGLRKPFGGPLVTDLGLSAPLSLAAGSQPASASTAAPALCAALLAHPTAERRQLAGALEPEAPALQGGGAAAGPAAAPSNARAMRGAYVSPLLCFRSYRLAPSYRGLAKLPLLSPTYAHAIDPLWPLCPFETAVRGACRDAGCAYQMRADYALPPAAVLQDVYNLVQRAGGRPGKSTPAAKAAEMAALALAAVRSCPERIPLPAAGTAAASGPPAKSRRIVPPEQRQQVLDAPLPQHAAPAAPVLGRSGAAHCGEPAFASPALTAAGPALAPLLDAFLPKSRQHGDGNMARPHRVDNARVGRYFTAEPAALDVKAAQQSPSLSPSAAPQPAAAAAATAQGTAEEGQPAAEAACLAAAALAEVDRALDAGSITGVLWDAASLEPLLLLRLRLLQAAQPSAAQPPATGMLSPAAAAAEAAARCPGSYAAWVAAADAQPHWRDAAATLQRGIVAMSAAGDAASASAGSRAFSGPDSSLAAHCLLDLALRLLATWTAAGQAADAAAWVGMLLRDAATLPAQPAGSKSAPHASAGAAAVPQAQLPAAAARAVVHGLSGQPGACAVLWLAAAHLAARGQLPPPMLHRLGQRQRAEALEWGTGPPPSSCHARVGQILRAAAGGGAAGLHLLSPLQVTSRSDMDKAPELARARQALAASMAALARLTSQQPLLPVAQLLQLAPAPGVNASGRSRAGDASSLQELPPQLPAAAAWANAAATATSKSAVHLLGSIVPHGPLLPPPSQQPTDPGAAAPGGLSGADLRAWAALEWPGGGAQLAAQAASEAAAAALPRCLAEAAADSVNTADGAAAGSGAADAGSLVRQDATHAWGVAWRLVASVKAALTAAGTPAGGDAGAAVLAALGQPLPPSATAAVAAAVLSADGGGPACAAAVLAAGALDAAWCAPGSGDDDLASWRSPWRDSRQRQATSQSPSHSRSRAHSRRARQSPSRSRSSRSSSRGGHSSASQSDSASSWTSDGSGSSSGRARSRSTSSSSSGGKSRRSSRSRSRSATRASLQGAAAKTSQPAAAAEEPEAGEIPGELAPAAAVDAAASVSPCRGRRRRARRPARRRSRRRSNSSGSDSGSGRSGGGSPAAEGWDAAASAPRPQAVAAAFDRLLQLPPDAARAASDSPAASLDEGEVLHGAAVGGGNAALGLAERSHAALNLAAYHTLTCSAADDVMAAAGQATALAAEAGDGELQRHVWCEVMALAAAALTAEDKPDSLAADAAASGTPAQQQAAGIQQPAGAKGAGAPAQNSEVSVSAPYTEAAAAAAEGRRHRFADFMAWVRRLLAAATARVQPPLAAETLQLQDVSLSEVLCGRGRCDWVLVAAALAPVLPALLPAEMAEVAEAVAALRPAPPDAAQLLLLIAASRARDAQWAAWALPLAAGALLRADPPAPPAAWLQAVALAAQVSKRAEAEVAAAAVAAQPRSAALWRRHTAAAAAQGGEAKAAAAAAMEAAGFTPPKP